MCSMINRKFPEFKNTPTLCNSFYYKGVAANSTPTISIVTPYFNSGETINETAITILGQSLQNFEWIIVNDGSTDENSLVRLKEISKKDNRVRIINCEKNGGLPKARNIGLKNCNADFIYLIDADDLIESTCLEKFYLFLLFNPDFDFVNCWNVGFGAQEYFWEQGFTDPRLFLESNRVVPSAMFRKSVFINISYDETNMKGLEDWDFWLKVFAAGKVGFTINEYLFWYRRRENHNASWSNWDNGPNQGKFKKKLHELYSEKINSLDPVNLDLNSYYKINNSSINVDSTVRKLYKTKKRVLFFFPWLVVGGADKFNLDLLFGLTLKNWEATIITTLKSDNEWLPEFSKLTSDIFNIPNLVGFNNFHKVIKDIIETREPDILVISHSEYAYWLISYFKEKFPKTPVIDIMHCEEPFDRCYTNLSTINTKYIDRTIVSTKYLKDYLIRKRLGNNECPIDVLYTNVDSNKINRNDYNRKKIRDSWNINDDYVVIIYAARFVKQKQPMVLAETIKKLKSLTVNFVCLAFGEGPLLEEFKIFCNRNDITDKIWCMHSVSQEELDKYMDAADIFLLTSTHEGISTGFYKAMAKKLVVVGANVGGQSELIDHNTGVLINNSNPDQEILEYTDILYELVCNRSKRERFQSNARKRVVELFDINQLYNSIDKIFTTEINKRPKPIQTITSENYLFLLDLFMNSENVANTLWQDSVYLKNLIDSTRLSADTNNNKIIETLLWYKSENSKLTNWYNTEYECLPIWYKRIGHIIKVIIGKRTLKSLIGKRSYKNTIIKKMLHSIFQ